MSLEGPSGPFAAHLVVPVGPGPHPLVVHVPGVGMHGVMDGFALVAWGVGDVEHPERGTLTDLGVGTLSITVGLDAYGTPRLDLPRSEIRELVRIATEWAVARDDVATEGHVMVGTDFGAADAALLGEELGAGLVIWHRPEVRTVGEYIEDELLRRDWFRRREGDDDGDGALSPEEWGAFRATSQIPEDQDLSFDDIDLDGDGRYTVTDDELEGATSWGELQALLAGDDEASWSTFWVARARPAEAERWQGHPSLAWPTPAWARDAWDGPAALPLLGLDGVPLFIFRDALSSPMSTPLPPETELGRAKLVYVGSRGPSAHPWGVVHHCLRVRLAPRPGDHPDEPCRD